MELYHTTALSLVPVILTDRFLRGDPYVSLSAGKPVYSDIGATGNLAVIAFLSDGIASQVFRVHYTDEWYDDYTSHAAYIAGEGWSEQYTEPEEAYDEDMLTEHREEAERSAFLCKSEENEWISIDEDELWFDLSDVAYILVETSDDRDNLMEWFSIGRYNLPVRVRKG